MKKLILVILFLSINYFSFSQNQAIDSLLNVVRTQNGKEKIETLLELSSKHLKIDLEKSYEYTNEALKLSEELKISELNSKIYNSFALLNYYRAEYESCKSNSNLAIQFSEKFENIEQKAVSYRYLGCIYQVQSNYDSSLISFEKEKEIQIKSGTKKDLASCYTNIGLVYQLKGNFKTALENYLLAEELFTELNEQSSLISLYGKIGGLLVEEEKYEDAEKYLSKAQNECVKNENYTDAARFCNAMGVMYKKKAEYQKAEEKYKQALEYLLKQPSKQVEAAVNTNIGLLFIEQKQYDKAIEYLKKTAALAEEIGIKYIAATANHNIGEAYFYKKNYSVSLEYYLKAHLIFIEIESYPEILKSYQALIKIYKILNNSDLALEYYEKYDFLKDSINQAERSVSLDSLQTVFDTKYLKTENLVLEKDAEIKKKTISNQRILIFSVIAILLLAGILIVLIIRNSRIMKKFIAKLSEKNEEILQQSEELRQINDKLVELSNFKEGMMQMIIHDLKNPLNILQNIRLYATDRQIEKVETISYSMLNLIQNILDVYKYEKSRINLNFESVPVLNLIETSLKEINTLAQNTNIQIVNNLDEKISVKCDINVINRVLINLFTNAVKYSPSNSEIKIEVADYQDEILFSITNQGEEIPPEYLDKIFDKFTQVGKNAKKYSSGLGLSFCKLAIESHGKIIKVSSEKNKTTFTFSLPKAENFEVQELEKIENKSSAINLSESEKNAIQPYIKELSEIPIYKISAINSVIEKIKTENHSEIIISLCSEILETVAKGNDEKFQKIISNLRT